MSARLFKRLALSASVAVLMTTLAAATVQAQDTMPAMPAPSVGSAAVPPPPGADQVPSGPNGPVSTTTNANGTQTTTFHSQTKPALTIVQDKPATQKIEATNAANGGPLQANGHATAGLPGKVSIADAVAFGVSTNPEYLRNADNRRATDEELRQAKGLYLPSLDAKIDGGPEYADNFSTRHDGDNKNHLTLFHREAGLTLTQMLFDGNSAPHENMRQEARVLSAAHRVREAAELTGLSVVEAYLDVLRQRELLRIARDNVSDHLNIMEKIADSANAGRSTAADNEQVKARLAAARATEAQTRESLREAEAEFIQQVGDPPQDLVTPVVPSTSLQPNVEEEVKISLHQSPTIDIYEADVAVAHEQTLGAKSAFYPKVDIQANANTGRDIAGVKGQDTDASALLVMNWNLYRGGIDTANVREQINREAQAKEERSKAARQVENDVRTTWARMVAAGERAKEYSDQAAANVETVKAYKDQFDLNRRTLLDVLDAQNELFVSRSNAVDAEFVEMFAVYRLIALKGELLPTLGVSYPRESDPAKM